MPGLASRSSSPTVAGRSPALESSGGPARPRRAALTALAAAILALALTAPATAAPALGPAETLFSTDGPWGIAVADMDGDGRADVITGGFATGGLNVALQQADGSFTSTRIDDFGGFSRGVHVADFNVDGRPDVAVRGTTLRPLLQNGDGTFAPGASFPSPNPPPYSMGVGDVDDDGRPDIIVGGSSPRGLTVALQQPDGTFLALPTAPVPGAQIDDIEVGDVDGDGANEIVAADATGGRVVIASVTGLSVVVDAMVSVSGFPTGIAVDDIDGDGKDEVAVARWSAALASIVEHDGGAYVLRPDSYPTDPAGPGMVDIADFDGDGRPDIVVGAGGGNLWTRVHVLHQQADGGFVRTDHPFGSSIPAWDMAVGDIDGDGNPDVVLADPSDDNRVVLLHNKRDTTDPTVTLTTPVDGATYDRGSTVNADFACADGTRGSGIDTCVGTVADGDPIDTATLGPKSFQVTATDHAGNTASKTVSYTVVDGDDPTVTVTTPVDGATYDRDEAVNADFACADEAGGSGIDTCVGTVADGDPIDTATLGPKSFQVTATDHAGNTASKTVSYTVVDRTDPTVTLTTPVDGATYDRDEAVNADFACADEAGGSGIDTCVGTVDDGDPIDTATLGPKSFKVTAEDKAGNTASKTVIYTIAAPAPDPEPAPDPDPAPDPEPAPVPERGPTPAPGGQGAALPSSDVVPSCREPFVTIVDLRPTGNRRRPRTKVLAVAAGSLAGSTVAVRRDGRQIRTGRVGADGRISISVPAPEERRARARARYRLVVGDVRSRALKATRRATISTRKSLRGGGLQVTGRIVGLRHVRTLVVTGEPVCGDDRPIRTRIRTDRHGRFRATLAPPRGRTTAVTYRIRYANRTATLPVLLTRPDGAR
ncbi:MAG: FG-GAP repeat domain-containing protein [Solirubrobacteraceae bacterium]